jgi:cell division septal protein FtsQ
VSVAEVVHLEMAADFRRRGAPPRRRRRSLLLALAKPLGVAVLTVALPVGLGTWVLTSRRFQLRDIAVRRRAPAPAATQRVQAAWVLRALAPLQGRNLLRLPLAEVRQRLAGNRWVAAADVAKELPDRLLVTVAERRPVVLLRSGEALLFADAAGLPIAPVASPAEAAAARRQGLLVVSLPRQPAPALRAPLEPPGPPGADDPLPAVRQGEIAGALRLAEQLRRLRPAWGPPALSQIDVVDEDDYQLHVEGLPCPLLVRGSRLAGNLVRFDQLLPELTRRYPALAVVDLRFSRRIVVQPAAAPPPAAAASRAAAGEPRAAAGERRAPANH